MFISSIGHILMNVFAKFDEIPSMILQDIKETKCYGHKNVSDTRSDNMKTVYPPTNTVCGGYNQVDFQIFVRHCILVRRAGFWFCLCNFLVIA